MIPQSETVIAKWERKQLLKSYYKVWQKFIAKYAMYYKLHLVEQSASCITKCSRLLIRNVSGITKCDRLLLQSASGITKWDVTTGIWNYWKKLISNMTRYLLCFDPHKKSEFLKRAISKNWPNLSNFRFYQKQYA